jgi:hypothetical protein
MRESKEDWLALGRDLIARGLGAPLLIVADGAPGLVKAVEQCWPASDRQHCAVHRLRNLLAKLPERERERVRQAYEGVRRTVCEAGATGFMCQSGIRSSKWILRAARALVQERTDLHFVSALSMAR